MMLRPVNPRAAYKLMGIDSAGEVANPARGKGLYIKAKSSEYGPIAGDIPQDARLNKLAFDKKVSEYQISNLKSIEDAKQQLQKYISKLHRENADKYKILFEMNEADILERFVKQDDQERNIYYVVDNDDDVCFDNAEPRNPLFFVYDDDNNHGLLYNKNTNQIRYTV